jgi:hypothetical protein
MNNVNSKHEPSQETDASNKKDAGETTSSGEGKTDIREANENIRKSQGEDGGQRPTIDRHR